MADREFQFFAAVAHLAAESYPAALDAAERRGNPVLTLEAH